jgi:hypothetical protein
MLVEAICKNANAVVKGTTVLKCIFSLDFRLRDKLSVLCVPCRLLFMCDRV